MLIFDQLFGRISIIERVNEHSSATSATIRVKRGTDTLHLKDSEVKENYFQNKMRIMSIYQKTRI